ncbi:MAG: hypothetical protein A2847_02695 [Candidatus Sungbacteria bacterium RIFCSPHIGHO2_01_FULL_50_25]|uniref:General secretion pathway GspH domain-containing protein n=1 Tax=Candidatus Sungbacteria bacterium RIFCSPHIGHO2_01_FULL_50_25 TaxID=1802265 RepID=A0A1G2KBR9_9BACT|nr:MAG: hypothetical protein A2847_02695 [Candidatus Sungbacteria bacterium RIFCSPHIGHO2_01_FULL_50_25]
MAFFGGNSKLRNAGRAPDHFIFEHSAGYTAVELIIVAGIMVTITAAVLIGFGTLNTNAALNRAARDLGVSLRRAQNMSLAVSGISAIGNEVPPAVGVQLTTSATSYILFGDRIASEDLRYTSLSERIETTSFERNVRVSGFETVGSSPTPYVPAGGILHVLFSAPEADPKITDGDGTLAPPDSITIILEAPNGNVKKVTVRESGEVSIK